MAIAINKEAAGACYSWTSDMKVFEIAGWQAQAALIL
jgi:hypothetical protein